MCEDFSSQFGHLKEENLVEFVKAVLDRVNKLEDKDKKRHYLNAVAGGSFHKLMFFY